MEKNLFDWWHKIHRFNDECISSVINYKCPDWLSIFFGYLTVRTTYASQLPYDIFLFFRRTPSFYNVIPEDAIQHWTEEDDVIIHNPLEDSSLHHHNHPWILFDVARTEEWGGWGENAQKKWSRKEKQKTVNCEDLFTAGSRYLISPHNASAQLGHQIFSYRMMYGRPDWLDNLLEGW